MAFRAMLLAGRAGGDGRCGDRRAEGREAPPADDPFTWLEEIEGERALAWARNENTRTLGELQGIRVISRATTGR